MNSPAYQQSIIPLTAGGSSSRIPIFGDFLACIDATGPFRIAIDGDPATTFLPGLQYLPPDGRVMQSIRLEDTSGAANDVTMAWGVGGLRDSRATIAGAVDIRIERGTNLESGRVRVNSVPTLIRPANAARKSLLLRGRHTNTDVVGLGTDNTVDKGLVMQVEPGAFISIDNYNGAIWGDATVMGTTVEYLEVS